MTSERDACSDLRLSAVRVAGERPHAVPSRQTPVPGEQ